MSKSVIVYLSDDDYRLLELCEASGLIPNRSDWFRTNLVEYAVEHGIEQAFTQELERAKALVAKLEAVKSSTVKADIDKELVFRRLVEGCRKRTGNHRSIVGWLSAKPIMKEVRFCRPGKSIAEVVSEIEALLEDRR